MSPNADPVIVAIMTKLAQVMVDQIYPDNGFFFQVDKASIDAISLNDPSTSGQREDAVVMIEEEFDQIEGSNANTIAATATLAVHGHIRTAAFPELGPTLIAARFRQDITRVLRSVSKVTLSDVAGNALCRSFAVTDRREIKASDIAEGYAEVIVRVAIEYRDSSPPVPGI